MFCHKGTEKLALFVPSVIMLDGVKMSAVILSVVARSLQQNFSE